MDKTYNVSCDIDDTSGFTYVAFLSKDVPGWTPKLQRVFESGAPVYASVDGKGFTHCPNAEAANFAIMLGSAIVFYTTSQEAHNRALANAALVVAKHLAAAES